MLVRVDRVAKSFGGERGVFGAGDRRIAVDDVSLEVEAGGILGLVGESGSGKSTLARMVAGLLRPDAGTVRIDGTNPADRAGRRRTEIARRVQMVFQDPYSSLNPRLRIGASIMEPLAASGADRRAARRAMLEMLERVGIPAASAARYPHEFSGGQRQRVCIARALVLKPDLVVLDEAVSALDVSIKSQVLNLLNDLKDEFGTTFIFISHDLATARQFCTRVAVMLEGRIVEVGPSEQILRQPSHPYTQLLISSIPRRRGDMPDGKASPVPGAARRSTGCKFAPRCPVVLDPCWTARPGMPGPAGARSVACHLRASTPTTRNV